MSSDVAIDTGSVIIHEGCLFKTPPLDKFFMNWKKRWFVLSRRPTSLELTYYTDTTKKEKLKSIDVRNIKNINPIHNKPKENVFSLELVDGKKFMLRCLDKQDKAIWVAKLLECCSKEGSAFHVTVPTQPTASHSECILKLTTPLKVNAVSSSTGEPVMTIPFNKLRRFGCQIAVGSDIVWFETCSCCGDMEEFQFFVVALGIEKACQIVQEYKRSIELALRDHLIMEEGDQSQFLYSYVVKSHYGHPDYPAVGRERILQSGLMSLSTSGGSLSLSDLNKFSRSRPSIQTMTTPQGPIPGDVRKLSTPGGLSSPTPSPMHSPRTPSPNRSLEQLQHSPRPSRTSQNGEFDSGVNMEPLDPSRNSAPCFFPALSQSSPKAQLAAMRKGRSFDERPSRPRVTLKNFRAPSTIENKSRKASLAELQLRGTNRSPQAPRKDGYDSAMGSANDLITSPPGRIGASPTSAYDRLKRGVAGMSLHPAYSKRSGPAYVES